MKKNLSLISSAVLSLLTIIVITAQPLNAQKVKVTNPGATVEFVHCVTDDAPCETANRVRNDIANLPYINGVGGVSAVFNLVSGSKDLTFSFSNSTRFIRFDFRDQTYLGGAPAWWYTAPQQNVKPFANVLGAYSAKEQCGSAAACDINYPTRMNAGNWKVSGSNDTYALLWNPTAAATRPVNSPETTSPVNVNYIKDTNGERFIITPLPNATSSRIIAGLEKTSGRTVSGAGQYQMPFTMTVKIQ